MKKGVFLTLTSIYFDSVLNVIQGKRGARSKGLLNEVVCLEGERERVRNA